jgi:hypothetical protein
MSQINEPDDGSDRTPNVVHLRDYSDQQGWASLPGPAFGYRICFRRGSTREVNGNLHPGPQLVQNLLAFAEHGGPHLAELSAQDLRKHVILTQAGRKVADLVISESAAASRKDIQANYDANVFSRAEAIPIIAHYLRTQQIYVLSPLWNQVSNRKTFYHSAVYAMLPSFGYWEAKLRSVIDSRYVADTRQMIGRLIRALKAFDDLRFHLGALQTIDSYDDAADCVDRILWSLCGAVDVAARSLHVALKVAGPSRNAKFHGDWYAKNFRPVYSNAVGVGNVDRTQAALATVYKLRNTIHSHALSAAGASSAPTLYVGKEYGRVRLLIPRDVYDRQRPRREPPTPPNSPAPSPICSHSTSVTISPVRTPTVPRKLLRSNHSRKRRGSPVSGANRRDQVWVVDSSATRQPPGSAVRVRWLSDPPPGSAAREFNTAGVDQVGLGNGITLGAVSSSEVRRVTGRHVAAQVNAQARDISTGHVCFVGAENHCAVTWAEGVDDTIDSRQDSSAGLARERDDRSLVDEVDAAVATHGGVEIVCRGEKSCVGVAEIGLQPADAPHPRRDSVEDQGLCRHVGASQRRVDQGADALRSEIHEQPFAYHECGAPGWQVDPDCWISRRSGQGGHAVAVGKQPAPQIDDRFLV